MSPWRRQPSADRVDEAVHPARAHDLPEGHSEVPVAGATDRRLDVGVRDHHRLAGDAQEQLAICGLEQILGTVGFGDRPPAGDVGLGVLLDRD